MTAPRAQLRVFSPLEAFPPREREGWRSYLAGDGGLSRRQAAEVERRAARYGLRTGRFRGPGGGAMVRRAGRRLLLCPLELELRAALALETLRATVPPAAFDGFLWDSADRRRFEALVASGRTPHVRDAPWAPALVWFAAFAPGERRFTDPPEGPGARVVYFTLVSQALERVERVHEVVESTLDAADDLLGELGDLSVWLDAFDPTSLLELDYADVAGLFTSGELRTDHTCGEVWQAVDALEDGDPLRAAEFYGVARARWERREATPMMS